MPPSHLATAAPVVSGLPGAGAWPGLAGGACQRAMSNVQVFVVDEGRHFFALQFVMRVFGYPRLFDF